MQVKCKLVLGLPVRETWLPSAEGSADAHTDRGRHPAKINSTSLGEHLRC
jgi:hypothetical protein